MMGDAAAAEGDYELAERCYAEAHHRHPQNPRAALNLGVTRVERHRYAEALTALGALDEMVGEGRDGRWIELSLAGRYNAALAHWYRAFETPAADTADVRQALVTARGLALDIGHLLLEPQIDGERRQSLRMLEGGGLALLAGVMVDAVGAHVVLGDDCAEVALDVPRSDRRLKLHRAAAPPPWLEALAGDRWYRLTTVPVLEHAARHGHRHDGRTRYNLALLHARFLQQTLPVVGVDAIRADPRAHGVDRAFADLEFCLESDPSQLDWAREDVLLRPLAAIDPERFARLVPPESDDV